MKLIKKIIKDIKLTIPRQALPIVKEIWDDNIYNKIYKIKKGDVVFDIGANVGIFSLYAASKGAQVYSFEPNPDVYNILVKNIKNNNFKNQIYSFNTAIGADEREVCLSIPNSDKIFSEASASISNNFIQELEKSIDKGFKTINVNCSKIINTAKKLNTEKIDLMKLDCEGAEYDIIKSLPTDSTLTIKNLAMEMHGACYSQKELNSLILEKGFIIDKILKISDDSDTGFLYCSYNSNINKTPIFEPIADFKIINSNNLYIILNNEISIDGTYSFTTNTDVQNLKYTWYLNNKKIIKNSLSRIKLKADNPGLNSIKLEVKNKNRIDIKEKYFFTVQPDYPKENFDYIFIQQNEALRSKIGTEKKSFIIPGCILPKYKKTGSIVLGIEKYNSDKPAEFEFNGKKIIINSYYEKIQLNDIHFETDIIFTICLKNEDNMKTDIVIKWWEAPVNNLQINEIKIEEGNNNSALPSQGIEHPFIFQGEKKFSILHNMYPLDWIPNKLIIGIDVMDYNNNKNPLNGVLNILNNKYILNDFYKEIKLNEFDLDNDLDFKINLLDKNCIKLTWWNE